MYEYVTKAEYKPIKHKVNHILQATYSHLKGTLPFRYELIGSGKRHLITRVKGGNKGFDFDYNLVISPEDAHAYAPKTIRQKFMDAMNPHLKKRGFSFAKDSTSVITIESVDQKASKIRYSSDFAIIYYDPNKTNGYWYLRNDKNLTTISGFSAS